MTWHQIHCWTLTCDVCGDGWDDAAGQPHFDTREALTLYAEKRGWLLTPLRTLCLTCTSDEACAMTGHAWSGWRPAGPFPGRGGKPPWVGRVRHCVECSAAEWDPPVR